MEICTICGKEVKCLGGHMWKAHGPGVNHKPKTGTPAWNKGLTKDMDTRVAAHAQAISDSQRGRVGRPHTAETKQKLSNIRKTYLDAHPDQVPYLLNHSSKISYPEQYFIDCFRDTSLVFQYPVLRYRLDFANVGEKLYIEIDGEQHYQSRMLEHDARRTAQLNDLGWTGVRVRWAHFSRLNTEDRINKVAEIKRILKV